MRRRSNGSKVSATLTAGLVFFVAVIAFVVGVLSGQSFSDRNHAVQFIENNETAKTAYSSDGSSEPGLGDHLTEKEIEALTAKALDEARTASRKPSEAEVEQMISDLDNMEKMEGQKESLALMDNNKGTIDKIGLSKTSDQVVTQRRKTASVPAKGPTTISAAQVEFTIQVAAYKTMKEAKAHSSQLKGKGLPAFPLKASVKGETWYKVNVGSFPDLKSAKRYDRRLKKEGTISASFIRKVKRL